MTDSSVLIHLNNATAKKTVYQLPKLYGNKQPVYEDKKGNIWLGGMSGTLTRVTPLNGKISNFSINTATGAPMLPKLLTTAIYEDDGDGSFWFGAEEGFAHAIFEGGKDAQPKVTWYKNNPGSRNSLNYNYVSSFLNDPSAPGKYLWISTKGGGLNRLDKTNGNFTHITQAQGLPNNVVYGLLADKAGNIWGSTNRGVFCLLAKQNASDDNWDIRTFTKADGLQDDEFNSFAYAKMPNGNLAFGGVNGVNVFNPAEILKTGFVPNVYITNILLNNQPVTPGDKTGVLQSTIEQTNSITLSYLQDILTLEFTSLDFTAPEHNKYRYQLVGIDRGWVQSGTRNSATYVHLPPGNYTFKVQGSNSQGTWSDHIVELKVQVLPPWWLSWWAYTIYFTLLVLGIRAYVVFMGNRSRLKAQLHFEQAEAKRIKELDTVKTQLYTNITHEFRTPLTVILGMAKKIADNPAANAKTGTEMIMRNGQSLLKLVTEMLDLSKLQSGKMVVNTVKGDIIVFVRYIVESFHSLAENQKKHLHYLSDLESYHTEYDAEKMRQIISNLLSNALKFTPENGHIYISLNEAAPFAAAGQTSLIIRVKDTGIGIPQDKLPLIFDRFYRVDNSSTNATEGTGIGLALTKELVKLMNAKISVKSPPTGGSKGTEFMLELPFKKLNLHYEAAAPIHLNELHQYNLNKTGWPNRADNIPTEENERPLILLVEDNTDVVAYTASCLNEYRLAIANDGVEGFEAATEMIPDLIISDVMMPRMNGFELLKKLRAGEFTSHIPVIMLTAKADMESKMEGIMQGADVYLEKPFNSEELLARIKKLLELRKALQNYYLKSAGLAPTPLPEPQLAETEQTTFEDPKAEDKFVLKVRQIIEAHIADADLNVELLCRELFMSHSKLHRKLSALTGCPPNKFIRIIRLSKAKELLKDERATIASVAIDCGYGDPGYFARVFKQEFGVTPNEWKLM